MKVNLLSHQPSIHYRTTDPPKGNLLSDHRLSWSVIDISRIKSFRGSELSRSYCLDVSVVHEYLPISVKTVEHLFLDSSWREVSWNLSLTFIHSKSISEFLKADESEHYPLEKIGGTSSLLSSERYLLMR